MACSVVGTGRRAHLEGTVDARAHEVGAGERLAALACGQGEGCCWVIRGSDRGIRGVGDTATLGIWASRRTLARFWALEAWRRLSGVLAFVSWGVQSERGNVG